MHRNNLNTFLQKSSTNIFNSSVKRLVHYVGIHILASMQKFCVIMNMGAIRWGHGGRVPPLFQTVGIQYAMFPTVFSLGFVIY